MVGGWVYGVWCMVGVWWITTVVIIRPSQPSLAGVGAGAELGKNPKDESHISKIERVTGIFVSQPKAKYQFLQIFK